RRPGTPEPTPLRPGRVPVPLRREHPAALPVPAPVPGPLPAAPAGVVRAPPAHGLVAVAHAREGLLAALREAAESLAVATCHVAVGVAVGNGVLVASSFWGGGHLWQGSLGGAIAGGLVSCAQIAEFA